MARARSSQASFGRKYGVARSRKFGAKLRLQSQHARQKHLRRIAKASRQFNLMRAKGKR